MTTLTALEPTTWLPPLPRVEVRLDVPQVTASAGALAAAVLAAVVQGPSWASAPPLWGRGYTVSRTARIGSTLDARL